MIDQVKIGIFLKSLRKEKNKTQEEIADMFGVSSRSVSRWDTQIFLLALIQKCLKVLRECQW